MTMNKEEQQASEDVKIDDFMERREFMRMDVVYEIQCKRKGFNKSYRAWCTSLSGSGLSFLSEHHFGIDDEVNISIPPQSSEEKLIDFTISVVRCDFKKHGFYEVAAKLKKMKDRDFEVLSYRVNT